MTSNHGEKAPVSALILAKNESAAIEAAVEAASFCEQVIVFDSGSVDGTPELAAAAGAEVIQFKWNGFYPKKKQWAMEHPLVRNDWTLHLDADERVTTELAEELARVAISGTSLGAFRVRLNYHFLGRRLRHGHQVQKTIFIHRKRARYPEIADIGVAGSNEVEGHYQVVSEAGFGKLTGRLDHVDPDPLGSWIERHNRYSEWESEMRDSGESERVRSFKSRQGAIFDLVPFKAVAFFIYSYIVRLGFLDGRSGFHYAVANAFYRWQIGAKTIDRSRRAGP